MGQVHHDSQGVALSPNQPRKSVIMGSHGPENYQARSPLLPPHYFESDDGEDTITKRGWSSPVIKERVIERVVEKIELPARTPIIEAEKYCIILETVNHNKTLSLLSTIKLPVEIVNEFETNLSPFMDGDYRLILNITSDTNIFNAVKKIDNLMKQLIPSEAEETIPQQSRVDIVDEIIGNDENDKS